MSDEDEIKPAPPSVAQTRRVGPDVSNDDVLKWKLRQAGYSEAEIAHLITASGLTQRDHVRMAIFEVLRKNGIDYVKEREKKLKYLAEQRVSLFLNSTFPNNARERTALAIELSNIDDDINLVESTHYLTPWIEQNSWHRLHSKNIRQQIIQVIVSKILAGTFPMTEKAKAKWKASPKQARLYAQKILSERLRKDPMLIWKKSS